MGELGKRYDELTAAMHEADQKCQQTYSAWLEACAESKRVTAERRRVWLKMIDGVVTPSSRGQT